MSIKLSWRDVNAAVADSIKVYRSSGPIDPNNLPVPIATLAGNALEYEDTTVVRGTVYYYRVAAFKGADMLISGDQIHGYFPNNGPGPQTISRGDWKRGYFGRLTPAEFLTVADARTLCGVTTGSAQAEANLTHWHKFIFDGKILYIPAQTLTANIPWSTLYSLGLVYGTDNNGAPPPGVTAVTFNVNQKKVVPVKGFDFLVRLPKGATVPTTQLITVDADYPGSEWFETYGRCMFAPTRADAKARWDDTTNPAHYALQQHFTTNATNLGFNVDVAVSATVTASTASFGWFPVFELQY